MGKKYMNDMFVLKKDDKKTIIIFAWASSSFGRALASHVKGRRFDSGLVHQLNETVVVQSHLSKVGQNGSSLAV